MPHAVRPFASILMILVLAISGCSLSPQNGQEVCGANENVSFNGYIPWSSRDVQIQVSTTGTGGWTSVGTAKSAATGVQIQGVNYYQFSKPLQVPKWTSVAVGGAELHTFVRARAQNDLGTGPYWTTLATFDMDLPSGTTPTQCLYNRMSSGSTGPQALSYCESDESPVAELIAPAQSTCTCTNVTVNGDILIDSPVSAAQYACTQTVNGSITITDAAPELVSLPALQTVTGNITWSYSYPFQTTPTTAYRRRLIEAPLLAGIGGNASLTARRNGGTVQVPNGLDAVTYVGGDITLTLYDANPNVFGALTAHDGNLTIQGFPAGNLDINVQSSFELLTEVAGDVTVQDFFATNSVLNQLQHVGGDLNVARLRFYPSQSFGALQTVGGNLQFLSMKQLGPTWPALTSVGGELGFIGHATTTGISGLPVGAANVGSLRIQDNTALTALSGTSFQVGAGGISISGNPALSQCAVIPFLAAQQTGGWTGTASVTGTIPCSP